MDAEERVRNRMLSDFLERYEKLKKAGFKERSIAYAMGFSEIPRFRSYVNMARKVVSVEKGENE